MAISEHELIYPDGPPTDFIGGHLLSLRRNPLDFLNENMRYGDLTHLKFMKYNGYQINHPDLLRQVLTTDNAIWHKSVIYKRMLKDYLGDGILSVDGEYWRTQRKLMQPAFHVKRVGAYADTMVEYALHMLDGWQDGEVRDVAEDLMAVTLNIVGKTLFNSDFRTESERVAEALEFMLENIITASQQIIHLPEWIPTPTKYRKQRTIEMLDAVVMPIITARRQSNEDTGDLLSMLMLAQDEDGNGMTDKQLRDEAMTIVLAGHETTANALTWTLYLLSQNPDIYEQLQTEIDTVLSSRPATMADLRDLPYAEKVIKESMRLLPPVWSLGRQARQDTELGGYAIPKYSTAIIPIWSVHRDARWYPNPQRFDPDRWTEENEANRPRYAYLPFGAGPRVCIGNSFAMMEAVLLLATILQQVRVSLVDGHPVEPEPLITLRPKYGMKMHIERR